MAISKRKTMKRIGMMNDFMKKEQEDYQEPENWTIITALDRVVSVAGDCSLEELWETCKNPLAYLNNELGTTNMQTLVLGLLAESGNPMSWKEMARYLNLSRLTMMTYTEEIEELVRMRWAKTSRMRDINGGVNGLALVKGVTDALRHNKKFVPEKIDGLNEQQFMDKLEKHLEKSLNDHRSEFEDVEEWMIQLAKANPHLPLCHEVLALSDIHEQSLLLLIAFDYAQWADSEDEGLRLESIDRVYPDDYECDFLREQLTEGVHILMKKGIIEHKYEDGLANAMQYRLTQKAQQPYLRQLQRRTNLTTRA